MQHNSFFQSWEGNFTQMTSLKSLIVVLSSLRTKHHITDCHFNKRHHHITQLYCEQIAVQLYYTTGKDALHNLTATASYFVKKMHTCGDKMMFNHMWNRSFFYLKMYWGKTNTANLCEDLFRTSIFKNLIYQIKHDSLRSLIQKCFINPQIETQLPH